MPGEIKIDDGSGNYTILTNAGSLGSDKTITIPNETGTLATTNGITEADIWNVTADYTGDANPIASNLARYTADGAGYIGTGMTQSSGVFTFPSTGIWKIDFIHQHYAEESYDISRVYSVIQITTNNSSYGDAAIANGSITDGAQVGDHYTNNIVNFIFDVTDTSTHKVRFRTGSSNTGRNINIGDSARFSTGMIFIRLGDT